MKIYSKIVLWILIYFASIGFILPYLFSESSNLTLAIGVLLIIILFYRLITFIPIEKVKSFIKEMFV